MTPKSKSFDIAQVLGRIETEAAARELFETRLAADQLAKIQQIQTPSILVKIANAIAICNPSAIFVNAGTAEDRAWIKQHALDKGEESALPMPDHTIHYDLKQEQGRIIDRTYYIADADEAVSSLALKKLRDDALEEIKQEMGAIMQGMTMIIGFYIRGPVGAPVSNPALEITSSAYVAHSAEILYRNAFSQFDQEVARQGHFYTNIHSEGLNRPEDLPHARVFMDRKHRTTYSFKCTYAGNTLLLKKGNHRFSVDRSVYEKRGCELAEHMFITGIDGPNGRITWVTGAAPSGCGKTTTAMAGNHFVGDDLAQMWIAEDGAIRSTNPECGIFGIVEDVNRDGDPMLMHCLREECTEVIWTNVLIDDNGIPHWKGNGEDHPAKGTNFQGAWENGMTDTDGKPIPISHPNARCTLSSTALGNYSASAEDPAGVETRVITYSGRDSNTMPPVWAARNADEGVVIGACIVSAATATEVGATGVKRAPWANAPFIPGALGDYMEAQFQFFGSDRIAANKRPVMAGLNYFLTHEARGGNSNKLLGEKRDVKVWLAWLERRAHAEVDAIETPIGYLPLYADLQKLFSQIIAKDYPEALYNQQFSLYIDNILARIQLQIDAYRKEADIPAKLFEVLEYQQDRLAALKQQYGPIVTPAQLIAADTNR